MKFLKHISSFVFKRRRGCRGCAIGCLFLLFLLAAIIACSVLLFSSVGSAKATAIMGESSPLRVWLLIDNSNSMFDKGGVGSDPDLLRIAAARLFIAYLGVDEPDLIHQVGVIFFGTVAETAVPPTLLHNDTQRDQLIEAIANPPRMGWTDHLAAMQLAQSLDAPTGARPALVLLTDGKPEGDSGSPLTDQQAYIQALRNVGAELATANIPLFLVLLANDATDADADIAQIWQPLWQELSAATPPGRYFVARSAADLPGIYHDIVVALTGNETAGALLDTAVPEDGLEHSLPVADGLAQMTLVISKSDPTQEVTIMTAAGRPLSPQDATARHAGQPGVTAEEIWVIEHPTPGVWAIRVHGEGQITIWQDYKPAATPLPTATIPPTKTPTVTPQPTATASSMVVAQVSTALPTSAPPTSAAPAPFPSPTPLPKLAKTSSPHPTRNAQWWWGVVALVLSGSGYGLYHWRIARRPTLSGQMRFPGAAANLPTLLDLDALARSRLTLGRPPADIPLPGAMTQAILYTGAPLDDTWEVWLQGPSDILLNGLAVLHDMPLNDAAILDFGSGLQARYENLPLRRAARGARRPMTQLS